MHQLTIILCFKKNVLGDKIQSNTIINRIDDSNAKDIYKNVIMLNKCSELNRKA